MIGEAELRAALVTLGQRVEAVIAMQPPASSSALRLVEPGANLQSLVADVPAGTTLVLAPGFVQGGGLTLPRPQTIFGGKILGAVIGGAPGITFRGVAMEGTTNGQTILTAADDCLVEDCTLTGSPIGQHRGILANAARVTVRRTAITNIWHSMDTQAIAGWDGTRDLLVEDCRLEASGENACFGGTDPRSEAGIPQDITFRRCTLTKPAHWRTLANCTNKNLFELKNAKRVLVEDCAMAYSFVDGQIGFAILLTVRNQDGTAPFSTIEDVIIRRTTVSHCAGGIQLLGTDYTHPSGLMKRVTFDRVTIDDISPEWGMNQRCVQLGAGAEDLAFRNCAFTGTGINTAMTFTTDNPRYTRLVVDGCTFPEGEYGLKGDVENLPLGRPVLEHYAPGYQWTNNRVVPNVPRPRVINWPAVTVLQ